MMDAQGIQYIITAFAAFLAAFFGALALHRLFQGDVISDTFTDAHHEIYMMIIFGFFLIAIGEITWVLIYQQANMEVLSSAMPDFYWVLGYGIVFIGTWYAAYRTVSDSNKNMFKPLIILLPFLSGAVIYFGLPLLGIGVENTGQAMLLRFYPSLSFVTLLMSAVLYYFANDEYYALLRPLLFISVAFLIGDILFAIKGLEYGLVSIMADVAYIGGYLCVAYMFYHKHAAINSKN